MVNMLAVAVCLAALAVVPALRTPALLDEAHQMFLELETRLPPSLLAKGTLVRQAKTFGKNEFSRIEAKLNNGNQANIYKYRSCPYPGLFKKASDTVTLEHCTAEPTHVLRQSALLGTDKADEEAAINAKLQSKRDDSAFGHVAACDKPFTSAVGGEEKYTFTKCDYAGKHTATDLRDAFSGRATGQPHLARVLKFMSQLASGSRMMSELKITHADIKTDNIFVKTSGDETSASWASNEPQLRLGDFGISAMLKPAGDKQCVFGIGGLSLKWASPESMILSSAGYGYQCVTSDVYSLGVVMFQFLAAKSAFPWMAGAGHIYGSDPPADTNKWFLKTRLDLATNALNDPDLPLLETTLIEKGQSSRKKNSIVQNLVVNYAKKIHDVYAGEAAGIKADIKAQLMKLNPGANAFPKDAYTATIDLLQGMLHFDPQRRLKIAEVAEKLAALKIVVKPEPKVTGSFDDFIASSDFKALTEDEITESLPPPGP